MVYRNALLLARPGVVQGVMKECQSILEGGARLCVRTAYRRRWSGIVASGHPCPYPVLGHIDSPDLRRRKWLALSPPQLKLRRL